jgi:hypothetical protein
MVSLLEPPYARLAGNPKEGNPWFPSLNLLSFEVWRGACVTRAAL